MDIGSGISVLLNRLSWAVRAGLQFGGKRNLYAVFGYKTRLVFQDFIEKYARQGIAKRIIDQPVSSTWNLPPTMVGPDDMVVIWNKILNQFPNFWHTIQKADRLAGLGRYATILIGYNDVHNNKDMAKPVMSGAEILYFQPYSELSSAIKGFVSSTSDPRFGLPEYYSVNLFNPSLATQTSYVPTQPQDEVIRGRAVDVHWTRIIHIADAALEDEIFGIPRLMPIYNDLDDLLKVGGGASEMFWLNAREGMQVDVDKDMELDEGDAQNLQAEIEEYQHELRRIIRTKGVKINSLGATVASPKDTVEVIVQAISAETGIPKSILFGMASGRLASAQDRANYATLIEARRTEFAVPCILMPIVQAFQLAGKLPKGVPVWSWRSAFHLSPLEEGQARAQMARSTINLSKALNLTVPKGTPMPVFISLAEARLILGFPAELPDVPQKPEGI